MKTHVLFGLILALVAVTSIPATEERPGRILLPPIRPRGILTHVPSTAGGREGIAVRIVLPQRPRYEAGAPVAISVAGGHSAGNATSRMNVAGCGFVEVSFAFPSGGQGDAKSGGTYDYRGPRCIEALRDVILFVMGKIADKQGRKMQDLAGDVRVLTSNVGLHGGSQGEKMLRGDMSDVTQILNAIEQRDVRATDELLPLACNELRGLAARTPSLERPGQMLRATPLVHEAYIRVAGA